MKRGVRVSIALAFALSLFITGCDATTSAGQNIWDFISQTIGNFLQELFSGSINDTMLSFVVGVLFLILIWALFHEITKRFGFFGGAGKVNNAGMALTFAASTMSTLSMVLYAQSKGTSLRESVLNLVSPFGTFGALGIAFLFGIMTFYSFRDTEILEDGIGKWFIVGGSAISVGVGFFYVVTGKPPVLGFWITFLALLLAFIFFLSHVLKGIGGGREPEFEDFGTGGIAQPAPAPAQPPPPPGQPPPPPGGPLGGGPGPQPPGPQPLGGPTTQGLPPEVADYISQLRQRAQQAAQLEQIALHQQQQMAEIAERLRIVEEQRLLAQQQAQQTLSQLMSRNQDLEQNVERLNRELEDLRNAVQNEGRVAEQAIPIVQNTENVARVASETAPAAAPRVEQKAQELEVALQQTARESQERDLDLRNVQDKVRETPPSLGPSWISSLESDLRSDNLADSALDLSESLEELGSKIIELEKSEEEIENEAREALKAFKRELEEELKLEREAVKVAEKIEKEADEAGEHGREGVMFNASKIEEHLANCRHYMIQLAAWARHAERSTQGRELDEQSGVYKIVRNLEDELRKYLLVIFSAIKDVKKKDKEEARIKLTAIKLFSQSLRSALYDQNYYLQQEIKEQIEANSQTSRIGPFDLAAEDSSIPLTPLPPEEEDPTPEHPPYLGEVQEAYKLTILAKESCNDVKFQEAEGYLELAKEKLIDGKDEIDDLPNKSSEILDIESRSRFSLKVHSSNGSIVDDLILGTKEYPGINEVIRDIGHLRNLPKEEDRNDLEDLKRVASYAKKQAGRVIKFGLRTFQRVIIASDERLEGRDTWDALDDDKEYNVYEKLNLILKKMRAILQGLDILDSLDHSLKPTPRAASQSNIIEEATTSSNVTLHLDSTEEAAAGIEESRRILKHNLEHGDKIVTRQSTWQAPLIAENLQEIIRLGLLNGGNHSFDSLKAQAILKEQRQEVLEFSKIVPDAMQLSKDQWNPEDVPSINSLFEKGLRGINDALKEILQHEWGFAQTSVESSINCLIPKTKDHKKNIKAILEFLMEHAIEKSGRRTFRVINEEVKKIREYVDAGSAMIEHMDYDNLEQADALREAYSSIIKGSKEIRRLLTAISGRLTFKVGEREYQRQAWESIETTRKSAEDLSKEVTLVVIKSEGGLKETITTGLLFKKKESLETISERIEALCEGLESSLKELDWFLGSQH